jgi:outer membrane protein OmpA-like peptidoglycan-associated protein
MSKPTEPRRTTMWAAAALTIAMSIAGCTSIVEPFRAHIPSQGATTTAARGPEQTAAGSGIVAEPASTAFPLEGRNIRLVRLDKEDLALQFELFNGSQEPVEPYDVGMGKIERDFKLVDLPRATAYDVQAADGFDGRVSDNQYEEIAPGSAATVTAVFTAPPEETTRLWFITDVLLPVEVPIEPAGSTSLKDDPVLTGRSGPEPYVNVMTCANWGSGADGRETSVELKLPSDVLFEFGKSDLTPAAQWALDEVEAQLGSAEGTVTIEGHTDAIGDDASNQVLSEARAASVQAALQERLGSEFSFKAVGFGESRPVAANTKPDGSDDPDGRAQNRRVEIRTGDVTAAAPAQLDVLPSTDDLSAKGAQVRVDSVNRIGGSHLLSIVTLTNPTSSAIEVPQDSGLTDPVDRPIWIGLADRTNQRRLEVCTTNGEQLEGFSILAGPPSGQFERTGSHSLLPGASVQLWGFYTAPPADVTTIDVEIGGLGKVEPTPITS